MKHQKLIEQAIEVLAGGSQTRFAKMVGSSQGKVWNWLNRDKAVSPESALRIELATNGFLTREQLRPDIFGNPRNSQIEDESGSIAVSQGK